jgi:hypothetical protein
MYLSNSIGRCSEPVPHRSRGALAWHCHSLSRLQGCSQRGARGRQRRHCSREGIVGRGCANKARYDAHSALHTLRAIHLQAVDRATRDYEGHTAGGPRLGCTVIIVGDQREGLDCGASVGCQEGIEVAATQGDLQGTESEKGGRIARPGGGCHWLVTRTRRESNIVAHSKPWVCPQLEA